MAYPNYNGMYGSYGQNSYTQPSIPPVTNNQYQNYNNQAQMGNFGTRSFMFATEEELKSQMIGLNSQLYGLDRQNSILRVKTVDAMGNVQIDAYKLSVIDESKPKVTEVNTSEYLTKEDIKDFVTKDELSKFMEQCKDIEKLLRVGAKDERKEENN